MEHIFNDTVFATLVLKTLDAGFLIVLYVKVSVIFTENGKSEVNIYTRVSMADQDRAAKIAAARKKVKLPLGFPLYV